jgi:VanZ family protein
MAHRKLKYFIPAIIWAAVITIVSSIPHLSAPPVITLTFSDKLAHLGEYFILGACLIIGLHRSGSNGNMLIVTILAGVIFGSIDELHQSFVPGRSMDYWDILADSIGSASSSLAYVLLRPRLPQTSPRGSGVENVK